MKVCEQGLKMLKTAVAPIFLATNVECAVNVLHITDRMEKFQGVFSLLMQKKTYDRSIRNFINSWNKR